MNCDQIEIDAAKFVDAAKRQELISEIVRLRIIVEYWQRCRKWQIRWFFPCTLPLLVVGAYNISVFIVDTMRAWIGKL